MTTMTMNSSFISVMRGTSRFMRSISATVMITFTMLILTPAVMAAKTELNKAPQATVNKVSSAETQLSKTLQNIEKRLQKITEKIEQHQDAHADIQQLKGLTQQLNNLDKKVLANFEQIETELLDRQLPPVILERHQHTVERYRAEISQLLEELEDIETASNDSDRQSQAQQAITHLKSKRNKRSQQPFDPNQLPNSSLKANPDNKPKQTEKDFIQAGLHNTPYTQLAALGDFTFDKLTGANNPAYLAETDEITLTQAIKDQATELNHDPVKIYHWVRNNIEWQPTWGAIQNAELTLSAKRGNAMDIGSLTIALLRASKIPARYVHGSIDVPAEQFKNWAGGFDNVTAAGNFASSGGIPITSIVSGGQISKIRLEHIWVEAAIDYFPSRGAKNKDADSWVDLDPSYKQYEYKKGLDVIQISGIDAEQLAQSFIDSGTVNETESWVTGFDATVLQTAQTEAQQKLESYIQNNMTNPTVGDVIGGRKTIIKEYPTLPSSLPNKIKVSGSRYDKLPSALQQTITWAFNKDILGYLIDPVSFPFAKVNNQKITLSFKPATEADEQALLSLLPEGEITDISQLPTSIPSYLIKVIPELKLNGQVIKTGTAMQLGEELDFITATNFVERGQIQSPRTYKVIAGSYLAVNAYAGSVSPQILQQAQSRLENTKTLLETTDQTQISALTRQELLGDMFHAGGLGYYAQLTALSHIMGLQAGAHHTLAAGTGTFGYEPNVDYFFGFPRAITPGGVVFDIPLVNINGANDGNQEKQKQFTLQTGILSSALEHAVPEQMFVNEQNPEKAISAVKALQKASAQGQRIYHITKANQSTILSNIHHDSETMTEIRNALNAGKEVITHTDAVQVPGWSGAGYIITDPVTGDGAYKIAGGGNGGFYGGIAFGITFSSLVALSVSAVISTGTGNAGAALAVLALVQILGPLFLSHKEAFGNDPKTWACWQAGFGIAAGLTPATSALIVEKVGYAALGVLVDVFNIVISGGTSQAVSCFE
ncbi:MAG: hypothetical protein GQ532_17325 [Methylomarinum sp.]|nr:hypothetical protein [Methylomarinum sp.]